MNENSPQSDPTATIPPPEVGMSPYQTPSASPQITHNQGEGVSVMAIDILRRTKKWVRLCSIIGFILSGLMIVLGAAMIAITSNTMEAMSRSQSAAFSAGYAIGIMLFYLVLALLILYPSIKLTQYASSIGRLLLSKDTIDLETALDKQRSFWKFTGITVLILVIFYALIFVVAFGARAVA